VARDQPADMVSAFKGGRRMDGRAHGATHALSSRRWRNLSATTEDSKTRSAGPAGDGTASAPGKIQNHHNPQHLSCQKPVLVMLKDLAKSLGCPEFRALKSIDSVKKAEECCSCSIPALFWPRFRIRTYVPADCNAVFATEREFSEGRFLTAAPGKYDGNINLMVVVPHLVGADRPSHLNFTDSLPKTLVTAGAQLRNYEPNKTQWMRCRVDHLGRLREFSGDRCRKAWQAFRINGSPEGFAGIAAKACISGKYRGVFCGRTGLSLASAIRFTVRSVRSNELQKSWFAGQSSGVVRQRCRAISASTSHASKHAGSRCSNRTELRTCEVGNLIQDSLAYVRCTRLAKSMRHDEDWPTPATDGTRTLS
jgi:hypothetical protein